MMLQRVIGIRKKILERFLARLRAFDEIVSNIEWKSPTTLVQYLKIFQSAESEGCKVSHNQLSVAIQVRDCYRFDCEEVKSIKASM